MKSRFISLLLVGLPLLSLTSCDSSSVKIHEREIQYINDNYDSYYQIFPYSFADSNGDGVGDLKGIIDKFDYIKSLNYTGLWLTPIHQSPSYHKYDVIDYKSIDSKFGSLDDYDELVKLCHDNNMKIILDLVINHSSDKNPWFENCYAAHLRNQKDNQYYSYYNFIDLSSSDATPTGYTRLTPSLAYESRFNSGMPDLNLEEVLTNPNGYLANEIKDILKFWLIDHDIDGFRLDAVTSYFTGYVDENVKFLTWLNQEARKLKENCFIVAEGSWGNNNENYKYTESGINGCFQFDDARADGYIARAINQMDASYLSFAIKKNNECVPENNKNAMAMPFITNHDLGRVVGCVSGRGHSENVKLANGILMLLNGSTFSYYGDEIGMAVAAQTSETSKDEDKRQPLNWGDKYTCKPVLGSTKAEDSEKYPFGSIKQQNKDKNSILNYIKKANLIRLQNPEIARGEVEDIYTSNDDSFSVISKTYNGKTIYIALNCSKKKNQEFDYSKYGNIEVVASLTTSSNLKKGKKDKSLIIPPMGIAILA